MSKSLTFEWKRRYAYHGFEVVFSCKKTLASTFQIVSLTSLPTSESDRTEMHAGENCKTMSRVYLKRIIFVVD